MPTSHSSRTRSRLYRIYRYAFLKLVRGNDTPERIGRGSAVGVFVGVFPTLWFGPLLAPAGAGLLGGNRAAALASLLVTGPLMPFLWTGCVLVGNELVAPERRIAADLIARHDTQTILQYFFTTFMLGNLVVSLATALAAYFLVWRLAGRHRERRALARLEPVIDTED